MRMFPIVESSMLSLSLCLMSQIDDLNLYFHLTNTSLLKDNAIIDLDSSEKIKTMEKILS
jgi:hypothetical protein